MKKISDVEHDRIKTEASRSAVVLSNGSIDNQGYLIRHVELREYTNIDTNLLIRIGLIDEKGEPNVIPLAYYFDDMVLQVCTTD